MMNAHHGHTHTSLTLSERHHKARAMIIVGAIANVVLSVIKVIAGWFGNSHALLADGIHSLADLVSDTLVYLASKFGSQAADREHPYGHQRIETITTIVIAALLLFTGLSIIIDGAQHIFSPEHNAGISIYVLVVAVLSLLINELVYRITNYVANNIHSDMLKAHAWHRRSDAGASLVVLVGIIGSMLGWHHLDGVAAIVVGVYILKMAWEMGHSSFNELVDRGVDEAKLKEIKDTIQAVDGVRTMHQLRTRLLAGKVIADVHVLVAPFVSVSEGHYIGDHVYQALMHKFPNFEDVTVHIDPEDDEKGDNTYNLPSRKKIAHDMEKACHALPGYSAMQLKYIHYLEDSFSIEIILPLYLLQDYSADELYKQYYKSLKEVLPNCQLKIFYG